MAVKVFGMRVAMILAGAATPVFAQDGIPAEFPPTSYTANQYVDSQGCAFVRAGMDGAVNWVPRVDRRRAQLCNFRPTFADAAPAPAPLQADDPIINAEAPSDPPLPSPVVRPVSPARTTPVQSPVIRSIPTVSRAAVAPRPVPRVATVPAVPRPKRITFAEACKGRFGVQRGFVSARTGNPIDCGRTPGAASGTPMTPSASAPLRLSLADACARIAMGERLVSVDGAPIPCTPTVESVAAPVRSAAAGACQVPNLATSSRYPVRCGPQALSPSSTVPRGVNATATVTGPVRGTAVGFGRKQIPASNPTVVSRTVAAPPPGYKRAWDDGRLNPQRGLTASRNVQHPVAHVSSRSVAPATTPGPARPGTTGHRYVQVGSFGDMDNAARLIARLQSFGLPVASGRARGLKVVAAGPFASAADLQRALGIVRNMGFSDAYTRG